jgi:hypothetical protein
MDEENNRVLANRRRDRLKRPKHNLWRYLTMRSYIVTRM